jgi:SAM-dependent methyltransferase
MTPYEVIYVIATPFLPQLHGIVRKKLKEIVKPFGKNAECLDVGGRKSPYTIGVSGKWTITDVPRESEIQKRLNLGINNEIITRTRKRRSNISQIVYDDITRSALPSETFNCVAAVEVLEHIREPDLFMKNIYHVLKRDGVFIMTTPNADHPGMQEIVGRDGELYYTKAALKAILSTYFGSAVQIEYAIRVGRWYTLGLHSWSYKHPVRTLLSMMANLVNRIKDSPEKTKTQAIGTRTLVATAKKIS